MAGPKADVIVRIAKSNSVFLRLCKQINAMQGTIDALLKQNAKLRKKVKRFESAPTVNLKVPSDRENINLDDLE